MKKIITLLAFAFCINGKAQYNKMLDFDGTTNGGGPQGDLMQASDGMLYGITGSGGANNLGVLFQYNPATSTYTKKFDFGNSTDGGNPYGSLIQASDGMLYGMTWTGGGSSSNCSGTGCGVLFQYNPTTNVYTKKFAFIGTGANGGNPYGSLMQASDGMLYGMTNYGGANSYYGVLFQYNPSTSTYIKKHDFDGTTDGGNPYGSLMQASDGMLYGMTSTSGASGGGYGVIFQYNPTTNVYMKKVGFSNTNGTAPRGSLMQASDGMLYGMTANGGASLGVIFQYNPTTSVYTKKVDLISTNGYFPNGSLMQASDGMLYGMTCGGGLSTNCSGSVGGSGCGVLFTYGIGAVGVDQHVNSNKQLAIYPNPTNGNFTIEPNSNTKQTMQVYDVNGKLVLTQTINAKTTIDAGNLNEGVYNISLLNANGVINKKLVILR
jgi:uncharacterized repeat protein (TIGR03803 family)